MNTLESTTIANPSGIEEECAKFTIEEVLSPFVLHNITTVSDQYTLSFLIKSDTEGEVSIRGTIIKTGPEWTRHVITYNASSTDLKFYFNTTDNYYIYHPKLEQGSKDTDWTEAPEDLAEKVDQIQDTAIDASTTASENASRLENAESLIQQLVDKISMLVTNSEGTSLWEQTADTGWTFSMAQTQTDIETIRGLLSDLEETLGATDATIEVLSNSMKDIESSLEWVKVTTYEDEPCIALGETDSDFKLLITNTRIMFMEGTSVPAYISNQALNIKKAVIEEELQQGDFVWKIRSNGNMGLIWKGVTS